MERLFILNLFFEVEQLIQHSIKKSYNVSQMPSDRKDWRNGGTVECSIMTKHPDTHHCPSTRF
jgi:hypothetical protein